MIELINFTKIYPSQKEPSVTDFSMKCQEGQITGLLGLNGAGKTTVLKAICGRHFASEGKVLVNGLDASLEREKVRSLTGFVTEEPDFPGEYSVAEYLKMRASFLSNNSSASICLHPHQKNTLNLIKTLSLEELLPKKLKSLSKGQRQRVNFAQALIHSPQILILDEPASGLDPSQILKMRELVKSLKKDHTILISTHLMQEVEALCDTIYIIHKGRLALSGSPNEIIEKTSSKNLEEAFFKITESQGELNE
ncbi:MAG: ABC transporter ATP-binding protein [Treponema sp.]|nr:ABC transporter ATP-binding protein [Treponema sp.]